MCCQVDIGDVWVWVWLVDMQVVFFDVWVGDCISGCFEFGVGVQFFVNGQLCWCIVDLDFVCFFFGIWLSLQILELVLCEQLLGSGDVIWC